MDLVGSWTKIPQECAERYPDRVQFKDNGLYYGTNSKTSRIVWDVGEFKVEGDRALVMTLANDKEISYEYVIRDNELTIIDEENCKVKFLRDELG